jgi:hypothetical protein
VIPVFAVTSIVPVIFIPVACVPVAFAPVLRVAWRNMQIDRLDFSASMLFDDRGLSVDYRGWRCIAELHLTVDAGLISPPILRLMMG